MTSARRVAAEHRRGQKPRLGPRRGEGAPHPGRACLSSSWLPELLRQVKAQNAGATESVLLWSTRKLGPHATEHAPYRVGGNLSSVDREAAPLPPRSAMELVNLNIDHLPPPLSGWKLGTEEAGKQKPNKQREPLQKGPCNRLKSL